MSTAPESGKRRRVVQRASKGRRVTAKQADLAKRKAAARLAAQLPEAERVEDADDGFGNYR